MSPVSEFVSSRAAASSMQHRDPAAFNFDTNQTQDITQAPRQISNDHHSPAVAVPRSSPSLPFSFSMGSSPSKPSLPTPVPSSSTAPPPSSSKGGNRLRRVFGARRKKSEDASTLFPKNDSQPASPTFGLEATPSSSSTSPQIFGFGKKAAKSPVQLNPSPPPLPPPKNEKYSLPGPVQTSTSNLVVDSIIPSSQRSSVIPISPGISSAVNFMRMGEEEREAQQRKDQEEELAQQRRRPEKDAPVAAAAVMDKGEMKETWRKSDSTIGHHTIRPGATSTSRASRPVSMAESVQSTHTIVPTSKRLSALITDADFGMPEEDGDDFVIYEGITSAPSENHLFDSSAAALRARDRRSVSLSHGVQTPRPQISSSAPSAAELKHPSHSFSEGVLPPVSAPPVRNHNNPAHKHPVIHGFAAPAPASAAFTGNNNNIRGRFSAWTANNASNSASAPTTTLNSPVSPPQQLPRSSATSPAPASGTSFRQTAISMTSGLAPAASLAMRAVEKMGKKMGMGIGSSSSSSGHSSSTSVSSSNAPSSYSSASHTDYGLVRTGSNQSTPSVTANMHLLGKGRRTPNAPSGTYSVTSSMTSASDSDQFFTPSGPTMGKLMRGPVRNKNGVPVSGGVVFGKDLEFVVRETAIDVDVRVDETSEDWEAKYRELETRMLPALVARCAQHLLIWGVQEEGLFRVNGRSAHVSKLRSEFDTGVDYDMTECGPGDLDPHAVASVFKAYLRELPEPILTRDLLPYFDAAINEESISNPDEPAHANPRNGLPAIRKPPSLSTLALPSFQGMRPPSKTLLGTLKTLINQLPAENRDLIRTVVDLIKATARESKGTKMPLSNLLVVFCPSLSMSPPLLRVLCDGEGIWESSPVVDIRRDSAVLDIRASVMSGDDTDEDNYSDALEEESSLQSFNPSSDYHASAEEEWSLLEEGEYAQQHRRPKEVERPEVPTLYLDAKSRFSSSSPSSAREALHIRGGAPDNASTYSGNDIANSPSPPLPSSPAESVATPASSGHPSFSHLPLEELKDKVEPQKQRRTGRSVSPRIAEPSPKAISKKPHISTSISSPVQFPYPSSEKDFRRRSIPILSLSSHATDSPSPAGSNSARLKGRKPSLRGLFSKRSTGSLGPGNPFISSPILQEGQALASPYLQPRAASDSSISTPRSAVTASEGSSTSYLLPVLDTPIEAGPSLRDGMGMAESPPSTARGTKKTSSSSSSNGGSLPGQFEDQDSKGPDDRRALFPASASQSSLILSGQDHIRDHPTRERLISTASSNHLGLLEDEGEGVEDWTQSVLLAANDGSWKIPAPEHV